MIRVNGLSKSYGGKIVLDKVDFQLRHGEFAFLKGASGSGKSTLLKLLYRAEEGYEGTVEFDGRPLASFPKHELRRNIGIIFQSYELLARKTVFENVALSAQVRGMSIHGLKREIGSLLERVGLGGREQAFPHQLSGGEQQRVAIVRALLNRPKLLLADEPTGNLDAGTASGVMRLMRQLNEEEGIAMLVVTHSRELPAEFPAATWEIADGRIRRHEPEHLEALQ